MNIDDSALIEREVIKSKCELDHLFFVRYFFKKRQNIKFRVNWHHVLIARVVDELLSGKIENLIINVPPGSSKTEMVSIGIMARGLALNSWAKFLHISYSDDLTLLNSQAANDLVSSPEYQAMWPTRISPDADSKKRWNVEVDGKKAGGVYAVSLHGQVTGFRAGHMEEGFQGAIIIDDPLKPEDGFSAVKRDAANRRLVTTVKSRKANPKTPIILIMQRIAEEDPTGFILEGNLPGQWTHIRIPAIIDDDYVREHVDKDIQPLVDKSVRDEKGRYSYWEYKEPIAELVAMESGKAKDSKGGRISRFVYASQYDQNPVAVGGNIIRGSWFFRYKKLPTLKHRIIYADTAQKTSERNDFSVFGCFGVGVDGKVYLIDLIRGRWEAPELERRCIDFWNKHKAMGPFEEVGALRKMKVEDKSSGTGLIQKIKTLLQIPIDAIQRSIDKLTRVMDVVGYLESGCVGVPEDAPFVADFITECESFSADGTHSFDDQVDVLADAVQDLLGSGNNLKAWESYANAITARK